MDALKGALTAAIILILLFFLWQWVPVFLEAASAV